MRRKEIIFLFNSGADCCVLTGFRVESDFENFKGDLILGPNYFVLTGFRVESDCTKFRGDK